MDTAADGP